MSHTARGDGGTASGVYNAAGGEIGLHHQQLRLRICRMVPSCRPREAVLIGTVITPISAAPEIHLHDSGRLGHITDMAQVVPRSTTWPHQTAIIHRA